MLEVLLTHEEVCTWHSFDITRTVAWPFVTVVDASGIIDALVLIRFWNDSILP